MRLLRRSQVLLGLAVLLAGCPSGEELEFVVQLRTDFVPNLEFSEVEVLRERTSTTVGRVVEPGTDVLAGWRIAEFAGVSGTETIRVRLLAADGRRVIERRQVVQIQGTTSTTVVITRNCAEVVCEDGLECLDGRCVAPGCSPQHPELCVGTFLCDRGEDCPAPAAACAVGACLDGTCFQQALECPGELLCSPERGCVSVPGVGDGGMVLDAAAGSDGGSEDGGLSDAGAFDGGAFDAGSEDAGVSDGGADASTGASDAGSLDAGSSDAGMCGQPCELAGEHCEQGRWDCSGAVPTCVGGGMPLPAGTSCRTAVDICDAEEVCDGASLMCPSNAFAPVGIACAAGFCDGAGGCDNSCVPGEACATGDACALGELRCTAGVPECIAVGPAPAGTLCHDAMGECDVAEFCDGTSMVCPEDRFARGVECNRSRGPCDVAESCDGTGPTCPVDRFVRGGTACGGSPDACERQARCTGFGAACPSPALVPAGTVCRAADPSGCDLEEVCSGRSGSCPSNSYALAGTVCRAARPNTCELDATCSGVAAGCPLNPIAAAGTECRGRAGNCDVAETCSGTSRSCPANVLLGAGTVCAAADPGSCELDAVCSGTSADCPAKPIAAAGTVCRVGGGCDAPEECNGTSASCPPDRNVANGTPCPGGDPCTSFACQDGTCRDASGGCRPGSGAANRLSAQRPASESGIDVLFRKSSKLSGASLRCGFLCLPK